jgi:hypothetical protein
MFWVQNMVPKAAGCFTAAAAGVWLLCLFCRKVRAPVVALVTV